MERASIVSVAAGLAAGSQRVGAELQVNGDRWLAAAAITGGRTGPGEDSGQVEVGGRFSTIDLTDAEVRGGRQSIWTAGVGWVPVDPLRFVLQYQHAAVQGGADDLRFQAVALRAQVKL